ncbi:MAG: hypothetical protein QM770_23575 [Tepidisphaeraceae bacterium]
MAKTFWSMYALGEAGLPTSIESGGQTWALETTVKHDFWAATGFYRSASGERAVVKINRQKMFVILPLRWIGRWLGNREMRAYRKLQDLPNIPRLIGPATDTGFAHSFIEGGPLTRDKKPPDGFFDELQALTDELKRRGIAYVDSNKPQNILLGDDGRPYLIDFQVSCDASQWWPPALGRWVLNLMYRGDVYHVAKNKRRFRPDLLTDADKAILARKGFLHRLHGIVSWPYHAIRKPTMKWLERSGRVMPEKSK